MPSPRLRLSPHFLLSEFDGHGGIPVPPAAVPAVQALCRVYLEPMRVRFGLCRVNSGFRTVERNRAVGGAPGSRHLYAVRPEEVGADVTFRTGTPEQWAAYAISLGAGGVGLYRNHVHVDNRRRRARW